MPLTEDRWATSWWCPTLEEWAEDSWADQHRRLGPTTSCPCCGQRRPQDGLWPDAHGWGQGPAHRPVRTGGGW
jgi:hypothetical protein